MRQYGRSLMRCIDHRDDSGLLPEFAIPQKLFEALGVRFVLDLGCVGNPRTRAVYAVEPGEFGSAEGLRYELSEGAGCADLACLHPFFLKRDGVRNMP